MFEVWTRLNNSRMFAPIAWFNKESDALEYAEYLETTDRTSEVHYNATAIMPDWDYQAAWSHIPNDKV